MRQELLKGSLEVAVQRLSFTGSEAIRTALHQAVKHSAHGKYEHRLHCLLLVGAGRSCYEVAAWFGDDPRSVERWVHRFNLNGLDGLTEKAHRGRQPALDWTQMHELATAVATPACGAEPGARIWTGTTLQREILQRFGLQLSARQCQRVLNALPIGTLHWQHRAP